MQRRDPLLYQEYIGDHLSEAEVTFRVRDAHHALTSLKQVIPNQRRFRRGLMPLVVIAGLLS
jgi:hypothetical protein